MIDARFLLPRPPRTAATFGAIEGWRDGLDAAGVDTCSPGEAVDLVVAPAARSRHAIDLRPQMIILEWRGGASRLRTAGYGVSRFLARPLLERPDVLLTLGCPRAATYAVEQWSASYTRRKRARNSVSRLLLRAGVFPDLPSTVTVAATSPGPPYVIAAAADVGVPAGTEWFLTTGALDQLSRNVFHLFPPGATTPEWVLKFARVPGYEDSSRRDEQGLRLAQSSPAAVRHAPALVGRFQVEGLHASIETAAVGTRLRNFLAGPSPLHGKLDLLESIASWLLELSRETVASAGTLAPERQRLLDDVVAPWVGKGADVGIVQALETVPAVLQHSDVDSENVIVGPAGFTVLDWEYARRPGLPLADMVYFLTDSLLALDPSPGIDTALRLVRGEHPWSPMLFRWIRSVADSLQLTDEAVGAIVTLVWLDNGRARPEPGAAGEVARPPSLWTELAARWLREPDLGPGWRHWRGG